MGITSMLLFQGPVAGRHYVSVTPEDEKAIVLAIEDEIYADAIKANVAPNYFCAFAYSHQGSAPASGRSAEDTHGKRL
jgi:hypothetical protein